MEQPKPHYRIYALIIGPVLVEGEFMRCHIKKMDFEEQLQRKFAPIQGSFSEEMVKDHETYATFLPYVDPMKVKSKYVIYLDSYETDDSGAMGDAVRTIDRACRYLSIAATQDIRTTIGHMQASFHPYIYQIVRMYKLNEQGEEKAVDYKIKNYSVTSLRRPESSSWKDANTGPFLTEIANFHDKTLERALKYLYRSSIGSMLLDNPEKRALDHFKAIEVIVRQVSNGKNGLDEKVKEYAQEIESKLSISKQNSVEVARLLLGESKFKKQLEQAKTILNLTDVEVKRIMEMWEDRSTSDIAHPSPIDQAERYPNQFPLPSNVEYSGFLDSTPGRVILKYYEYLKTVYRVTIESGVPASMEKNWGIVNSGSESNHYVYFTNENDKKILETEIKTGLAKELGINVTDITSYELLPKKVAAVLRVQSDSVK